MLPISITVNGEKLTMQVFRFAYKHRGERKRKVYTVVDTTQASAFSQLIRHPDFKHAPPSVTDRIVWL